MKKITQFRLRYLLFPSQKVEEQLKVLKKNLKLMQLTGQLLYQFHYQFHLQGRDFRLNWHYHTIQVVEIVLLALGGMLEYRLFQDKQIKRFQSIRILMSLMFLFYQVQKILFLNWNRMGMEIGNELSTTNLKMVIPIR